ncbi:unnamed protein product, partial [Amoebophrya sp. A25]
VEKRLAEFPFALERDSEAASNFFVHYSNAHLQTGHNYMVILREVGTALLAGISTIARDAGRAVAVPVNSQIGLIPFFQFLLNHTRYDSIQAEAPRMERRNLVMSELIAQKQQDQALLDENESKTNQVERDSGLLGNSDPQAQAQVQAGEKEQPNAVLSSKAARALNVVRHDVRHAVDEALELNAGNGFQGKMMRIEHPPLVEAVRNAQKRAGEVFLDGEFTNEYMGETTPKHALFRRRVEADTTEIMEAA